MKNFAKGSFFVKRMKVIKWLYCFIEKGSRDKRQIANSCYFFTSTAL